MEKYHSITNKIISISVVIALILLCAIQAKSMVESYNSVITLRVIDLTNDQFNLISEILEKETDVHIDYVCQESGIMVIKLTDSKLKDKGDIHTYIKSTFNRAAKIRSLEILHIYTEDSSGGQC